MFKLQETGGWQMNWNSLVVDGVLMTREKKWHIHVNTAAKTGYMQCKDFVALHKDVGSECFLQHLWEFNLHIDAVCWGSSNWCRNLLLGISLMLLVEAEKESHAWDVASNSGERYKSSLNTHMPVCVIIAKRRKMFAPCSIKQDKLLQKCVNRSPSSDFCLSSSSSTCTRFIFLDTNCKCFSLMLTFCPSLPWFLGHWSNVLWPSGLV